MLMVILGAGASHDSVLPINSYGGAPAAWQPPTADRLFAEPEYWPLVNEFPRVAGLAERLRFLSGRDTSRPGFLELELRNVLNEATTDRTRQSELVAFRFYLQFLMHRCSEDWVDNHGGLTNQAWLVRELEFARSSGQFQRVLYVTFNYDCILDRALTGRFGWDPADRVELDAYLSDERFALFKLHGSYDWVERTTLDLPSPKPAEVRRQLIQNAGLYQGTGEYSLLKRGLDAHRVSHPDLDDIADMARGTAKAKLPALALPLMDKSDFACPPIHVETLTQAIRRVTGVIAIGWRGAEAHFTSLLKDLPAGTTCFVVSPTTAKSTAERLSAALPDAEVEPVVQSFSSLREIDGALGGLLGRFGSSSRRT